jgi:hypothetical protein
MNRWGNTPSIPTTLSDRRWALHDEGFDVLWDSAKSRSEAVRYVEDFYPEYSKFEMILTPISFRQACHFINEHHRHHLAPQGMKFALGISISNGKKLVGVLTEFPREDIFFLSQHEQRIIGFDEIVAPYPVQKYHPRKDTSRKFAEKMLRQVLSYSPLPFVEIHIGRTVADPLMELLHQHGIEFRLYTDGVPLGQSQMYI